MPTPLNPALTIAGPALIMTRGKTFYSKGNVTVTQKIETFNVESARDGVIQERESNLSMEVKFTPVGRLDALSILWPYALAALGSLIHHAKTLGSIDTATDIVTLTAHGFRDGAPVRLASFGVLPAGTSAATLYYLKKLSADTFTLHPTAADAAAGTNTVDITDAGTGTHRIIEQEPLVVQSFDGDIYTFHNSTLPAMPDLMASAIQTVIGDVTFECFRKFSTAPTDAAALYTKTTGAVTDTSFNPADIITQAYDFSWGSTAPWAAMSTKAGIKCSFPLTTDPVMDDTGGICSRRITQLAATLTARPLNIGADDIFAKLGLQGSGAGRGRSLSGTDVLKVSGTGLYVSLYGAFLKNPPVNFDAKEDRAGELTWTASRTYTTGAANPLWAVGATDPDA
ncbi:MAG TPA: hypothetical protein VL357_03020 [Rariglobus sp.]|jgi:hypothetical protein|nr:hypothetical protein [Rariglobus sp.]